LLATIDRPAGQNAEIAAGEAAWPEYKLALRAEAKRLALKGMGLPGDGHGPKRRLAAWWTRHRHARFLTDKVLMLANDADALDRMLAASVRATCAVMRDHGIALPRVS
jgi:hypothetical protein